MRPKPSVSGNPQSVSLVLTAGSSHAGRRTYATQKNELGIGMATIQQLMGHSSIQTTAIYCSVSDEQLRNAANAV